MIFGRRDEPFTLFTDGDDVRDLNDFDLSLFPGALATDALAGDDTVMLSETQNLGVLFVGNAGDDTITGSSQRDRIRGNAGSDGCWAPMAMTRSAAMAGAIARRRLRRRHHPWRHRRRPHRRPVGLEPALGRRLVPTPSSAAAARGWRRCTTSRSASTRSRSVRSGLEVEVCCQRRGAHRSRCEASVRSSGCSGFRLTRMTSSFCELLPTRLGSPRWSAPTHLGPPRDGPKSPTWRHGGDLQPSQINLPTTHSLTVNQWSRGKKWRGRRLCL